MSRHHRRGHSNAISNPRLICLEHLENRVLLHGGAELDSIIKINFQQESMINVNVYPELTGYHADSGRSYGNRGNGHTYGWLDSQLRPDTQIETRNRNNASSPDERYDTLNHMIKGDQHSWQIALDNGTYNIQLMTGDPSHTDQVNDINVISGANVVTLEDPDDQDHWDLYELSGFEITDGTLRLSPNVATNGSNQKLAFIEITPASATLAQVINQAATEIGPTGAIINGLVTDTGNDVPEVTIFFGKNDVGENLFGWDKAIPLGVQSGAFSTVVTDLSEGTEYFYRSLALNSAGIAWSPTTASFATLSLGPPEISDGNVADVTAFSATILGEVTDTGNDAPIVTLYYGPSDGGRTPADWDESITLGTESSRFTSQLNNLVDGTEYYFRLHALNQFGEAWSSITKSFTTSVVRLPSVENDSAIDVEAFSALVRGRVTATGNDVPNVTIRWGSQDAGTNRDSWENSTSVGPQSGSFSTTLAGLKDGQTYYYRAEAANRAGTSWASSTASFDTLAVVAPIISIPTVADITAVSATIHGVVVDAGNDAPLVDVFAGPSDGGTDIDAWEKRFELGTELGSYSTTASGLSPESDYFVRVRAENAAGTYWTEAVSFRTAEFPTLLITEFMASNQSGLRTRVRETVGGSLGGTFRPDWIEIHNPGDSTTSLAGVHITDDATNRRKWQFPPGVSIPAGDYLVVMASGLDIMDPRLDQNGYLHTNFKLTADGEYLALADAEGAIIDQFASSYPSQRPDISYGIDDVADQHYYATSTPGEPNGQGTINFVSDTSFSMDRGFYVDPFEVVIRSNTPGATIAYTTDGSAPTTTHGVRVPAAGDITPPSATVRISTTTMLRAMAFKPGFEPTNVDTHTYIFPEHVLTQATDPDTGDQVTPDGFPRSWGGVIGDYQVDPDIVDHRNTSDRLMASDLMDVETISVVLDPDDLFGRNQIYLSGSGSPRAASIELISGDGSEEFQINGSVQIQGGSSTNRWKDYKLSMRLKLQRPFGPTKLDHALYDDSPITSYDNIILDGVLNHAWVHSGQHRMPQYIQDQYVADLHNEMGGYSPYGRFMHVYLNGLYWGMYYVHDRPDHAWAAQLFGGEKEDFHAVKHNGGNVINNGTGGRASTSYNAMVAAVNALRNDPNDLSKWEELKSRLDVENFVTYLLANWFTGNHDWPHKNWYATAPADGPWRYHSWDAEHVTDSHNDVGESPSDLHAKLINSPEYAMLLADRIHEHFFNDGVLTTESTTRLWQERMDEIDRAIVGESARWGDNRSSRAHTRAEWLNYNGPRGLLGSYFPSRSSTVLNQMKSRNLYPDIDAPEFELNGRRQHGGHLMDGESLTIDNPNSGSAGIIYYTVDGSDPRLPGGAISASAVVYPGGPIPLATSSTVKSRIRNGNEWSALTDAFFHADAPPNATNLAITEVNYNPYPTLPQFGEPNVSNTRFEFIELQNIGNETVELAGTRFEQVNRNGDRAGISFEFAQQTLLPGEHIIVVNDRAAFVARYGENIRMAEGFDSFGNLIDAFGGNLNDSGETVTVSGPFGNVIASFAYNDSSSWPGRADGNGSSLELVDRSADLNDPDSWRSSRDFGGSPGRSGSDLDGQVIVSEILAHTDAPWVDMLELYNPNNQPIDIHNWYVSDSNRNYFKFRVNSETELPPHGYAVFTQDQLGFGFDGARGDDITLLEADDAGRPLRFMDRVEFGATGNGVSLGRWPQTDGRFVPMRETTFGSANSGPRASEILISEIYYKTTELEGDEPFVELLNTTGSAIDLFNWEIAGDVDYRLDETVVIGAREAIVLVGFDPVDNAAASDSFRAFHGIDSAVPLIGPYDGTLDEASSRIRVKWPDEPPQDSPGLVPLVLADEVRYFDFTPWPADSSETGKSIHRKTAESFGDLGHSWKADLPSPGAVDTFMRQAGDANEDRIFDQFDLIAVLQGGRYRTGEPATWREGDWNADGIFDQGDIIASLRTNNFLNGPYA